MKRFFFLVLMVVTIPLISEAQIGGIGERLLEKTKKAAGKAAKDKSTSAVDAERDKLDSTDFNYAITVIDNSGIMDIRDLKENAVKGASTVSNTFIKSESDKNPAEKCREILNMAETSYSRRWYKLAEVYFLDAKLSYENENLTNNINYSKVHADLGLLYATMGRYNSAEYYTSEA